MECHNIFIPFPIENHLGGLHFLAPHESHWFPVSLAFSYNTESDNFQVISRNQKSEILLFTLYMSAQLFSSTKYEFMFLLKKL